MKSAELKHLLQAHGFEVVWQTDEAIIVDSWLLKGKLPRKNVDLIKANRTSVMKFLGY